MRAILAAFIFSLLFLNTSAIVLAHPGNTAADGCHYCRTNCDKWGVPWNVRHCHPGPLPLSPRPPRPTPTPSCQSQVGNSGTITFEQNDNCTQDVKIVWDKGSNDDAYSIGISKVAGADPGPKPDTAFREYVFENIKPGTWYINLKAGTNNCQISPTVYWKTEVPPPNTFFYANVPFNEKVLRIQQKCIKSITSIPSVGNIAKSADLDIPLTFKNKTKLKITAYPMYGKAITKVIDYDPNYVFPSPIPTEVSTPTPQTKSKGFWDWLR